MIKYVIASHSGFSLGLKSTLNFLTNNLKKIIAISAYDDNEKTDLNFSDISTLLNGIDKSDKIVFMTDINSGSVSQKIAQLVMENSNVYLISGINVPLGLSILLLDEEYLNEKSLLSLLSDKEALPKLITREYLLEHNNNSQDE